MNLDVIEHSALRYENIRTIGKEWEGRLCSLYGCSFEGAIRELADVKRTQASRDSLLPHRSRTRCRPSTE